MRLEWVVFERDVQTSLGAREPGLHVVDGWSLERTDEGTIVATRHGETVYLDGYAYTYKVAVSDSADEARALPPKPVSSVESGAAVDRDGLSPDAVGSTPARLAKGKKR